LNDFVGLPLEVTDFGTVRWRGDIYQS